jgi:P63C domain
MVIQSSREGKKLAKAGSAKGGRARASVLTAEERSEIARNAVNARWAKAGKLKQTEAEPVEEVPKTTIERKAASNIPFSMFRGVLKFGEIEMECHVLSDGRRVFTQREIVRVLTAGKGSSNLSVHIQGNPLIDSELVLKKIIEFKIPGSPQIAAGREATDLIELCSKYLDARDQGKLRTSGQQRYAMQADIVIRSCAKVGIIALIDEATGYQRVRAKNALQLKLHAFIAEELQEWALMFPNEFWFELARLEGIHYSPRNRPLRWGKYIMAFVYDAIDGDVGKELRKKNPHPHFKKNHHQWLKEFGKDKLIGQIQSVITIMKLCRNMNEFREKFQRVFSKSPVQYSFDDIQWKISAA